MQTSQPSTPSFQPVIHSLLDTDLYKFTMMQAFLHHHPGADAEYEFYCRNTPRIPLSASLAEINRQLDHLCSLRLKPEELDFLRGLRFIKTDFVDFLEGFQLRRRFITATVSPDDDRQIRIVVKGPLLHCMMFEVFVLSIVNEVYFRQFQSPETMAEGKRRLQAKVDRLKTFLETPAGRLKYPFAFFDFGTRRRFSREWHEYVICTLMQQLQGPFRGTSNVDLARRHQLTPMGTMAHEYLQAYQGFGVRLRDFQKAALDTWVHEYRGDLGIALTDVVGMEAFLADFDQYFAKLFDGLRHDSGDPFAWGDRAIQHYRELGISIEDKRLVFSDNLTFEKMQALYEYLGNRIHVGFGIGTNLTNDLGPAPLHIVMKMVKCNGQPVAKLSDSPGKTFCTNPGFLTYLAQVFHRNIEDFCPETRDGNREG